MYPILVCSVLLPKWGCDIKSKNFHWQGAPFSSLLSRFYSMFLKRFNNALRLQVSSLQTAVTWNFITLQWMFPYSNRVSVFESYIELVNLLSLDFLTFCCVQ